MSEGEEITSIIFDLGSYNFRIGISGNDSPSFILNPYVTLKNENELLFAQEDLIEASNNLNSKIFSIMNQNEDCNITNFNYFESYFENEIINKRIIDDNIFLHPFLFSEPIIQNKEIRRKLVEYLFEKYSIPSFFICNTPVLSSFSFGKITCLMFDSGHNHTTAIPVNDGLILKNAKVNSEVNGKFINNEIKKNIEEKIGIISKSEYICNNIISDIKKNIINLTDDNNTITYNLPDKRKIELLKSDRDKYENLMYLNDNNNYSTIIFNSVNLVTQDIKKDLMNNIYLYGGNTLISEDICNKIREGIIPKVSHTTNVRVSKHPKKEDRCNACWLGCSILSSLGTFNEISIKKEEYEEHGSSVVDRKCI